MPLEIESPGFTITTTVFETILIGNGTSTTLAQTSYGDATATTSQPYVYPSIWENGTVTGSGVALTYGTAYYGAFAIEILTDCSWCTVTPVDRCDPETLADPTALPFRGITTAPYFVEDGPQSTEFLSLLDLPSDCGVFGPGAPYALEPVVQITETQTITSPYSAQTASTAPVPGSAITPATLTPSSTSRGPYYLSTDTAMSSVMIQSLSVSSSPIQTSPDLPKSSLGSIEKTKTSTTQYAIGSSLTPISEPQSLGPSPIHDITIGGLLISPTTADLYLIGTQTLVVDGPAITAAGTTISMASSVIVINGHTQDFTLASNLPANPPIVTIGSSIIMANPSGHYLVGTQTLTPGGPVITVSTTTISLATSAASFVVNGVTQTIVTDTDLVSTYPPSTELPLILSGTTLLANSAGAYVLGTESLVPGGAAITISGKTLSLAPSDAAIIVDGQTYTADYEPVLSTPSPAIATVDGQTVSLNSAGAYEIGSQTVTPGGSGITVDGTPVSLETVGTGVDLVIGGSTEALTAVEPTGTGGLGGIIFSALGAWPTQTATATGNPLIDTSGARPGWEIDWRVFPVLLASAVLHLSLIW